MISDVFLALFTLVSILVVAPIIYEFIGMASSAAGGFAGMVMQLIVPFLFISLVVSVGISARRRGR